MLTGKKILITAGPTHEPIDPVRYIANRSSGKMGYALALELAERGAEVILISGPTTLMLKHSHISMIDVETAEEMYQASIKEFPQCDIAILAAAVADFTPKAPSKLKIKKQLNQDEMIISLVKTKDILASLGHTKNKNQIVAGFSLETDHEIENAIKKLKTKNLDFIILNSLNDIDAVFGSDSNKITIIGKGGEQTAFDLKDKNEVAIDIVNYLQKLI
jgi:phosphopantothenoylcysteine decarboxylase / phosphopantothenate---cysteine ligase